MGPLTEVKIWHDNAGVNKSLFLDKVLISTGKLGETYVFLFYVYMNLKSMLKYLQQNKHNKH